MRGSEDQKWATNLQPTLNKWVGEASLTIFVTDRSFCFIFTNFFNIFDNFLASENFFTNKLEHMSNYNIRALT